MLGYAHRHVNTSKNKWHKIAHYHSHMATSIKLITLSLPLPTHLCFHTTTNLEHPLHRICRMDCVFWGSGRKKKGGLSHTSKLHSFRHVLMFAERSLFSEPTALDRTALVLSKYKNDFTLESNKTLIGKKFLKHKREKQSASRPRGPHSFL